MLICWKSSWEFVQADFEWVPNEEHTMWLDSSNWANLAITGTACVFKARRLFASFWPIMWILVLWLCQVLLWLIRVFVFKLFLFVFMAKYGLISAALLCLPTVLIKPNVWYEIKFCLFLAAGNYTHKYGQNLIFSLKTEFLLN